MIRQYGCVTLWINKICICLQMSLTFQQIILDAKKLVIRISDHENTADTLISEVEAVCGQIDNMKQVDIVYFINMHVLQC